MGAPLFLLLNSKIATKTLKLVSSSLEQGNIFANRFLKPRFETGFK